MIRRVGGYSSFARARIARAMYTSKALRLLLFEGFSYQQGISMMTCWGGQVLPGEALGMRLSAVPVRPGENGILEVPGRSAMRTCSHRTTQTLVRFRRKKHMFLPPRRAMEGAVRKSTHFLDTQPHIGSSQHPEHGSTLLMLSRTGACSLPFRVAVVQEPAATEAYERARRSRIRWPQLWSAGHIDLKLIQSLRHDAAEHMRAPYLWRPCGRYTVHPSGRYTVHPRGDLGRAVVLPHTPPAEPSAAGGAARSGS